MEEARQQLTLVLAKTYHPSTLTGAEFDPEVFERVWRSQSVQQAGSRLGWRGIAEAVWAAAIAYEPKDYKRQGGS